MRSITTVIMCLLLGISAPPLNAGLVRLPTLLPSASLIDSTVPITPPGVSPLDTIGSDIIAIGVDALRLFSAPGRWGAGGSMIAGGVIGTTGLLTVADDPVRTAIVSAHNPTNDQLRTIGNAGGTIYPAIGISVAIYGIGLAADAPSIRRTGLHVFQSALYAGVITTTLKVVIGRQRPFLNGGAYVFVPFTTSDDFNSLPSGHATLAFAVASSLSADIDIPWVTGGLYALATLTALSRIYDDRHWTSDVFLGAAIGTACGYGVAHLDDPESQDGAGLMIVPGVNSISIVGRW